MRTVPPELRLDPEAVAARIADFIRRQLHDNGFEKVVLGLSGGVDSAVAAALAARALGPRHVRPFLLPYRSSSAESARDAAAVAARLELEPETIEITRMADAYLSRGSFDRIRTGNVLARLRMTVLFDQARAHGAMVAGTSNKTETLLGYSTWYGDSACSFQPLGDLYKTQVWQLAEWLELPGAVVAKAPSADLWPGQTDEGELQLSYVEADRILHGLVDLGRRPAELVAAGAPQDLVDRIIATMRATEYKRRMPPVALLAALPETDTGTASGLESRTDR